MDLKRILPILLSMSGFLLIYSQTPSAKKPNLKTTPQELSERIVAAQKEVLNARDLFMKATKAKQPDPTVVATAEATFKKAQDSAATLRQAVPAPSATAMATPEELAQLSQNASALDTEVEPMASSATTFEQGLIMASLALGFISTVLSGLKQNTAAAILSGLVVLASGLPNAYPVHQRAVYYQTLANHSHSLNSTLALSPKLTASAYDNDVRQLAILQTAVPFPGTAAGDPTQALLNSLDAAKITQATQ